MANRLFSLFAPFLWGIEQNENVRLKGLVVNGTDVPVGGSGLEVSGGSSVQLQAYNRDAGGGAGAYIPANYVALFHSFKAGAVTMAQIGEIGLGCTAGSLGPPTYTLSTLPSASVHANRLIVVTNATGGPALCLSNGTNWRRVSDDTTVS